MNKSIVFVAALCLAAAACAAVDPTETGAPISFEQALQRAMSNSPELRKYGLGIDIAGQEVVRARSAFLPHVDLTSTTQQIEAFGTIPGLESLLLSGRNRVYNASSILNVGLNVLNGGADVASLHAAGERREEARLQLKIQRTALATLVLDRYHALRQAEIELGIATLRHDSWIAQAAQAREDFELGRQSALAVSEAEYEVQSAELTKAGRQRAYANARRDLLDAIGPEQAGAPGPAAYATRPAYDAVLARLGIDVSARANEVDIHASRVRQAEFEIKRARNRYFPRIDLFYRTTYGGVSENGLHDAFHDQGRDKRLFGVNMTWNLFDGFDTTGEVRAAALRMASAQVDRDLAVQEQTRRVNEVSRMLADMLEEEQLERRRLAMMQKRAEINQVKLGLGRADAAVTRIDKRDVGVQKLEVEKREEGIAYYKARLLLREGQR